MEQPFQRELPAFLTRESITLDGERIAEAIKRTLGELIRNLHVSIDGLNIIISGNTETYYSKQLASFAANRYIDATCTHDEELTVRNTIEVE
jgi:hypothetical protein